MFTNIKLCYFVTILCIAINIMCILTNFHDFAILNNLCNLLVTMVLFHFRSFFTAQKKKVEEEPDKSDCKKSEDDSVSKKW